MQRWGRTHAGTVRFFCPACRKSGIRQRPDVTERHLRRELDMWLGGKDSLSEIAATHRMSRQALSKKFYPFFYDVPEPAIPRDKKMDLLILDATYVHSRYLCALVAIDDEDNVYWRFAPYESFVSWHAFLKQFSTPKVVVMDGQKGLFAVARMLWPEVAIQRCQFHVISFAMQYLGRRPKDEAGKAILDLLYRLKTVKTPSERDKWVTLYKIWEHQYQKELTARNEQGRFAHQRLRSVRYVMRRALPHLFTYIDHPGTPNTTNLVEGWVNGAVAEALRLHRGLPLREKRMLVSIVLSHLSRKKKAIRRLGSLEPLPRWLPESPLTATG